MSGRLELSLRPEWEVIKATWDRCHAFFGGAGFDDDVSYGLSMVCQELLENAVKYGDFSRESDLALSVEISPRLVTIEVKSPFKDGETALRDLDSTVQWIRGYQNPFEAYVERLKQVSSQPFANRESGLGLVRIAYEGRCLLDFYVDSSNHLLMSAVYQPSASHPRDHGNLHG
jgi:hypothetical protein